MNYNKRWIVLNIFNIYFEGKCLKKNWTNKHFSKLNTKLHTTDALIALLSKNRFCFFFLIFWHAKITPFFRMWSYCHWFFTYLFLNALRFSNLICQAKSLIWTKVSGLSSSKLLSILALLRSILRIPISLQESLIIRHYQNLH